MKTKDSTKKLNQSKSNGITLHLNVTTERQTKSFSFFLKKQAIKPNSYCPIICRVTINGNLKVFSTQLEAQPEKWDQKQQRVLATSRKDIDSKTNGNLVLILDKLEDCYTHVKKRDGVVSPDTLLKSFFGQDDEHKSFLVLFDEHLTDLKELVPKYLTQKTLDKYLLTRLRVEQFMKKSITLKICF